MDDKAQQLTFSFFASPNDFSLITFVERPSAFSVSFDGNSVETECVLETDRFLLYSSREEPREFGHFDTSGKGEKKNKKQMAYVGAAYTIEPFCRTPDDVIDEVCRKECAKDRPQPKHKRVWVEMTRQREDAPASGKTRLFAQLGVEVEGRARCRDKPIVCLMDGERALWTAMRQWLPERTVGILDLYHVMEYLWKAAHCFHAEKSDAAEDFVTDRLRMLLEGKVGYLIGGLRRKMANLCAVKRKRLLTVIGYLENNRPQMRYDEYLAAGYPIGSGVIEGACRHVVKDRMELSGMRWTVDGAQSMLHLRSIYLNGDWKEFDEHRIQTEQNTLYSKAA